MSSYKESAPLLGQADEENEGSTGFQIYNPGNANRGVKGSLKNSQDKKSSLTKSCVPLVIVCITLTCVVGYFSLISSSKTLKTELSASDSNLSANIITMQVTNEYSNRQGFTMFDYPFLKDAYLMEPHRDSTVKLTGLSKACGVNWSLTTDTDLNDVPTKVISGSSESSDEFLVQAPSTGKYTFTLSQPCTSEEYDFTVWVKYVRRELMSLTEQDRDEFLTAMHTLWTTSTIEGKKLYGERYKSLNYFAQIHSDGGACAYCDQFHGGHGFLNSHVYLSAYFEQSLQLVNPKVSLHYMEYVKYFNSDAFLKDHRKDQLDGGTWTEIMTEKWFGASDPLTGHIHGGRWDSLKVPHLTDEFFEAEGIGKNKIFFPENEMEWWEKMDYAHIFNPYGLLRSPWMFSDDEYLLRYNNIDMIPDTTDLRNLFTDVYFGVSCRDYKFWIENTVLNGKLEDVMVGMSGLPHNSAHFTIAGIGGELNKENDDNWRAKFDFSDHDLVALSSAMQIFQKTDYPGRKTGGNYLNYTSFPFNYTTGKLADGVAGVGQPGGMSMDANQYFYESTGHMNKLIQTIFPNPSLTRTKLLALDDDAKKEAVHLLASRYQYDGDLATSAAAMDPIFWVLHGSMERLFQRIIFEDVLADKNFTTKSDCAGHDAYTPKFWLQGFFLEDESISVETLTNAELTEILDPTGEKYANLLNFVYESKEYNFCDDFESAFHSNNEDGQ